MTMEAHSLIGMLPRPYRIKGTKKETYDTYTINLVPEDGDKQCEFLPGQFNMIYAFGKGEVPISISGDPDKSNPLVHTIRAVGQVTKTICHFKTGEIIGIRGPFGTHWPVEQAVGKDVVIVAGGIGLAPLRPVMYYLLLRRENYGKVILLYGARTPNDLLFQKELHKWRSNLNLEVQVTVDAGPSDWYGNVGVVTKLIPLISINSSDAVVMICGPEIMIRFTVMEFLQNGIDPEQIFISMERNMKCGIGLCGHCQFGPFFVCKDGPVFQLNQIKHLLGKREI